MRFALLPDVRPGAEGQERRGEEDKRRVRVCVCVRLPEIPFRRRRRGTNGEDTEGDKLQHRPLSAMYLPPALRVPGDLDLAFHRGEEGEILLALC